LLHGHAQSAEEIKMKKAIVIGSGAGGATAARELQGKFQVTILEAGNSFHPFSGNLKLIEKVKKTGLFFNEKQIQWIFPTMKISKTGDGMVLVKGIGQGGTTTLSAGNAIRQDRELKAIGINLDIEYQELNREIPIYSDHRRQWHAPTHSAFEVCRDLGLQPQPTPKMIRRERCTGCGKCVLGCSQGAKWDSRIFLNQAIEKGAELVSGCRVSKITRMKGRVHEVQTSGGSYSADMVVLAVGGLGTPLILQQSGISFQPNLFVDPVLCVAARWENAAQNCEIPMPFIIQQEHFIISPYFDFLSFFFNPEWRYPAGNIFSLMIKLADTNTGTVSSKGIQKPLLDIDRARLEEGVDYCKRIMSKLGKKKEDLFLGTLNAGHPGGALPLTEKESQTLHSDCLPDNLYVADASLFPKSLGMPPILNIMALTKKICKACLKWAV
jgi:choline dehydrogenase-like flavoprotein